MLRRLGCRLSKDKESHQYKKLHETRTTNSADSNGASNHFDVISLTKQKTKHTNTPIDEGVFDFVDSPLSDKQLVSAGTSQTSRINVKKGPNGQDYEYEYIYYYYEDPDEAAGQQTKGR